MDDEIRKENRELPEGAIPARNGGYIKPGKNPNAGRPKGSLGIRALIKEKLDANNQAQAKALAEALIKQAKKGNAAAIRQVVDGLDGPIGERLDTNVTIKVVHDNPLELDEPD